MTTLAVLLGFILGLATYHAIRSFCRGLIRFGNALEIIEDLHND